MAALQDLYPCNAAERRARLKPVVKKEEKKPDAKKEETKKKEDKE